MFFALFLCVWCPLTSAKCLYCCGHEDAFKADTTSRDSQTQWTIARKERLCPQQSISQRPAKARGYRLKRENVISLVIWEILLLALKPAQTQTDSRENFCWSGCWSHNCCFLTPTVFCFYDFVFRTDTLDIVLKIHIQVLHNSKS